MDEELDIYEFEWWNVFAVFLVLLLISIGLIGISFLLVGKLIFLYCGYSSIGLCVSLFGLWFIKSVPKQIIFMKNSISIVPAIGVRKEYSYEEISRIVIYKSLPFKLRIYFSNNRFKVKLNPDRLYNYQSLQEIFFKKGLGRIIDRK